jgi:ATP-dependent Clp protease ATP-binding subunit ClpX
MTDAMFDLPSQKEVKEFTLSLDYAQEKFEKSSMALLRSVA